MQKMLRLSLLVILISFIRERGYCQLLDNYDGIGGLIYNTEGVWNVNNGQFEAQTGDTTVPEHSYASYDLSQSNSNWSLSKDKQNEWIGWIDLNYPSGPNGWGGNVYNCGMVLAANNSDFNATTTSGYAIGFKGDNDTLVVFRFPQGITGGTGSSNLPPNSTIVVCSNYKYLSNGVNFYVKHNSNGTWTIKYKAGEKLSDNDAISSSNYSNGSVTSNTSDETYSGTSYKYSGWIYAHSSGSYKAYFDNFGIGTVDQSLPIQIQDFAAQFYNNIVILTWTTASEIENLGFNIYRKLLDEEYSLLAGFLNDPALKGFGSTSERHTYHYTDKSAQPGATYAYLLSDVNYAGLEKRHYDHEVTVTIPEVAPAIAGKFKLEPIYPNPFNRSFTIPITLPESQLVEIILYDCRGQVTQSLENRTLPAGAYKLNYQIGDLSSGIYFVRINAGKHHELHKVILMK